MYLKCQLNFASVKLMKYAITLFWYKCNNCINKEVVYHIDENR